MSEKHQAEHLSVNIYWYANFLSVNILLTYIIIELLVSRIYLLKKDDFLGEKSM